MAYKIVINGYTPPAVSEGGYSVTPNKIWSANTGRSATGTMLGDIIATKYTITLQWQKMNDDDVSKLSQALKKDAFFPVTFIDEQGQEKTKNFYSADPTYLMQKSLSGGKAIYNSVSVELIEQ